MNEPGQSRDRKGAVGITAPLRSRLCFVWFGIRIALISPQEMRE